MSHAETILVGDVGGTSVRLAIAKLRADGSHTLENFVKLPGDQYTSLESAIDSYLSTLNIRPNKASLAIAGPIIEGHVKLTNRDWAFSESSLKSHLGFSDVRFYNDFTAMARSVPLLGSSSFESIYDGKCSLSQSPIVVAGPGTGFGMAILVPTQNGVVVVPSEGGHQAYAPQSHIETKIMHVLQKKHDFVSLELISSGSGMNAVYRALCEIHGQNYEKLSPVEIRRRADLGDAACLDVCEIRAAAVMGAVGDMALACGANRVVLAGGVSKRLIDYLRAPKAMARFINKGPQSHLMKKTSIHLLINPKAPLYGAATLFTEQ